MKYRIFAIVPNAGTLTGAQRSSIWKHNLLHPLRKMGHDVVPLDFDYDDYFVHAESSSWLEKNRARFENALWDGFSSGNADRRFDLCFAYLCDGFVGPGLLSRIRDGGCPILNYSCNNIHQFHLVRRICHHVDCNIFAESHASEKFAREGVEAVQMQMAAHPDFYRPSGRSYSYEASFIGQRYADRGRLVAALVRAGIDVQAFGPRWSCSGSEVGNRSWGERADKAVTMLSREGIIRTAKAALGKIGKRAEERRENAMLKGHINGILGDEEMVEVFSTSKVNLGFATVYHGGHDGGEEMCHLRLRDFEVPMSGGFYITKYTAELTDYFELGKEIESYRSTEELIDKCRYYLANDGPREAIRQAGLQRSVRDHTWIRRFEGLFGNPTIVRLLASRGEG